ncbi:MAG: hypothetical protein ABIQ78_12315, partial [Dokdonella sp.]
MDGMPKMQEQFSAMAMDGRYAENAGAIFGDGHGWTVCWVRGRFQRPRTLPTSVWVAMLEQ